MQDLMEWLSSPVSLGKSCHTPSLAWQLSPEVARSSSVPSTTRRAKATGLRLGSHILCSDMVFMKEAYEVPTVLLALGYEIFFLDALDPLMIVIVVN